MTPDEARALLDGTTPGPWRVGGAPDEHPAVVKHRTVDGGPLIACDNIAQEIHNDADAALIAAAPTLAAMRAGMRAEYAVEHQHTPGGQWHQVTGWSHEPPLNDGHTLSPDERLIRRYVTTPEEA